ncbi:MAG: hypothetical protein L0177_07680, partial [Chloroflexi bacterium]|nr:hypothetical protein [Chloroflexota bacterium]
IGMKMQGAGLGCHAEESVELLCPRIPLADEASEACHFHAFTDAPTHRGMDDSERSEVKNLLVSQ